MSDESLMGNEYFGDIALYRNYDTFLPAAYSKEQHRKSISKEKTI